MTEQDLMDALLAGIEKADAEMSPSVSISRGAASEILSLLIRIRKAPPPRTDQDGSMLFYCAACGRSFPAIPREDAECFVKWHYHRWLANCPRCGAEAVQNERYWR